MDNKEYILRPVLNAIYSFQKTAITQNKITFITTKSKEPTEEFLKIQNILQERKSKKLKFKVVNICDDLTNEKDEFFGKIGLHTFKCMHHLSNSRVVVYDDENDIPMSILTHKNSLARIYLLNGLNMEAGFYKDGIWDRIRLENYDPDIEEALDNPAKIIADLIIGEVD